MSKRRQGSVAILAGLMLVSLTAAAEGTLYRWKDAQGSIVVSDRPPAAGTEYETIATDSSVVRRVDGRQAAAPSAPSQPQAAQSDQQASSNSIYEKNPEYCESARKNLEVIDSAARIRIKDENGEMRYISDEERALQRQNNIEIIQAHCE